MVRLHSLQLFITEISIAITHIPSTVRLISLQSNHFIHISFIFMFVLLIFYSFPSLIFIHYSPDVLENLGLLSKYSSVFYEIVFCYLYSITFFDTRDNKYLTTDMAFYTNLSLEIILLERILHISCQEERTRELE